MRVTSRQEIYMQLHHISGNMHDTGVKLNKAEAARIAASKERDAMQTKMDELHSQVDQLQRTLNER
jgi:arginine decarboxylase-like protein